MIHRVILTYTEGRRRSVYKTDAGIADAERFAAEWAAMPHVATVQIRARNFHRTVKPCPQK